MGRMAKPGWYPDPGGSPTPRYWDGTRWSDGPDTPPQDRRGLRLVLVGLALLMAVVLALVLQPWKSTPWGGGVAEDTRSTKPTGSQWDELPAPSSTEPEPSDDGGRPVECPLVDEKELPNDGDWYYSGRMKYRGVPGWEDGGGWTIDFASERSGQVDQVTSGWVSITAIGQLSTKDFSGSPKTAAMQLIECMSTSYYYSALDHRESLENQAFTTSDGVSGWLVRENFWNVPDSPVTGDEVVVVVLDAGDDDRLTLFHSQAPIEDPDRKAKVAEALESLSRR